MGRRLRAAWVPATLAAILGLAAWARVASFPVALARGEVVPLADGDTAYHLWRTLEALRNGLRVPRFDPLMNWPKGAFAPWADGYDVLGALFAMLAGGLGHPDRARLAVALFPVVLGVLVVWATWHLARTALPGRSWVGAALGAALGVALAPTAVTISEIGRMDHHVLEALTLTWLAAWTLRALPAGPDGGPAVRWRFELAGALLSGLGVYGFNGTPLYVAMVAAVLAVGALRTGRALGAPGLVAGGLLAGALTVPAYLDHRRLIDFASSTFLQPLLLVLAGLGIVGCAWVGGRGGGIRKRRLLVIAVGLAVAAAAMGAVASRVSRQVHSGLTGWLFRRDPWLATIGEFQSILSPLPGQDSVLLPVHEGLGWSVFFLPVAVAVVAATLWGRPRVRALLFLTAVIVALTLVQNRFARTAIPFVAACIAIAVAQVLRVIATRRHRRISPAWVPGVMLLLFLADGPTRALLVPPRRYPLVPIMDAAVQLRDQPLPPGSQPGVLSNWGYGHQLRVMAGVPVVVNGFGSYLDADEFWKAVKVFRGSPADLDAYMDGHRIGAVVAGAATIGAEVTGANDSPSFAGGVLNQAFMTSIPLSPLLIAGSGVPGWSVPHLPHLLPRYATSAIVTGLGFPLPFLWTYERVAGARVRGEAPPGARVIAELPFTEWGRSHTYKAFAVAGPDGRWEMVLPFPSGYRRSVIRSAPRWSFAAGGGAARNAEVPEASVRSGSVVEVGRLEGPAAGD